MATSKSTTFGAAVIRSQNMTDPASNEDDRVFMFPGFRTPQNHLAKSSNSFHSKYESNAQQDQESFNSDVRT